MCVWKIIASYNCKGDTARLWPSGQRNGYKIDVNNAGWPFAGKAFKEKKALTPVGGPMEFKLVKHDEALKELKELWSAWTIEQHAYGAPYHLRTRDAKKKIDRITESRKWQSHGVKIN